MSRSRLTRGDRRAVRLACLLMATLPLAALFSAKANAEPGDTVQSYALRNATSICALLGQDDSDPGISSIITVLVQHGLTYYQSGEVLGLSTLNVCPQYNDRVLDWAHTVTGVAPVYQAGKVGGALGV